MTWLHEQYEHITRATTYAQLKGVVLKLPCKAATTGSVSLTGSANVDDVDVNNGDRILVWKQSDPIKNGIYFYHDTDPWKRTVDLSVIEDAYESSMVYVTTGSMYADTMFRVETTGPIRIDEDAIQFVPVPFGGTGISGTHGTSGTSGETFGTSGTSGTSGVAFIWRGDYGTGSYSVNDVVFHEHDGNTYICVQDHTYSEPTTLPHVDVPDYNNYWNLMSVSGTSGTAGSSGTMGSSGTSGVAFIWRGDYGTGSYSVNDVVFHEHDGNTYICVQNHTYSPPTTLPHVDVPDYNNYWNLMSVSGTSGTAGSSGTIGGVTKIVSGSITDTFTEIGGGGVDSEIGSWVATSADYYLNVEIVINFYGGTLHDYTGRWTLAYSGRKIDTSPYFDFSDIKVVDYFGVRGDGSSNDIKLSAGDFDFQQTAYLATGEQVSSLNLKHFWTDESIPYTAYIYLWEEI